MPKEMTPQQYGKEFEQKFREAMVKVRKEYPVYFKRFTDSRAAGAYVENQPADFLVGSPLGAFLVELKASMKYKSLKSCLSSALSDDQAKELYLWDRAYCPSLVLFRNLENRVEVWDGAIVSAVYRTPGDRLRQNDLPEYTIELDDLDDFLSQFLTKELPSTVKHARNFI